MLRREVLGAAVPHPDDASLLRELRRIWDLATEQNDAENFPKAIALCDAGEGVMQNNKYCSDTPALRDLELKIFFTRAIAHVRCGHHALAAEDLSKVLDLDPEYDMAHAYRAGELSDLGLHTLAISDYTTAIRLNSQDPANYFNRAQCHMKLNCPQRASRDLTVYIAFEGDDPEAFFVRAEAYVQQKKWQKAQRDLQKCLSLEPENTAAARLLASATQALKNNQRPASPTAKGGRPSPRFQRAQSGARQGASVIGRAAVQPLHTGGNSETGVSNSSPQSDAKKDSGGEAQLGEEDGRRRVSRLSSLAVRALKASSEGQELASSPRVLSPASPAVRFDRVFIREHARELGGSGGVPHDHGDGYALGIRDEHVDHKPLHIQEYEEIRAPARVPKDELSPAPLQHRRKILQGSMDAKDFKWKYKQELKVLNRIRQHREDSVEKDRQHNPEYGTLEQNHYPTATNFKYEDDQGSAESQELDGAAPDKAGGLIPANHPVKGKGKKKGRRGRGSRGRGRGRGRNSKRSGRGRGRDGLGDASSPSCTNSSPSVISTPQAGDDSVNHMANTSSPGTSDASTSQRCKPRETQSIGSAGVATKCGDSSDAAASASPASRGADTRPPSESTKSQDVVGDDGSSSSSGPNQKRKSRNISPQRSKRVRKPNELEAVGRIKQPAFS